MTKSPKGPTACDDGSVIADFLGDKYSFDGDVTMFPSDVATIQNAIMTDGPVEAAFTVYSDFEDYDGGIYVAEGAAHSGAINKVAMAPNQRVCVTAGSEGGVMLWPLPDEVAGPDEDDE